MDNVHWVSDLKALNLAYMLFLRSALRQQFAQACALLKIRNRRLAQRIEALDNSQMTRLNRVLSANIVAFDEALAMEVIVEQAAGDSQEEGILNFADYRQDQLRWRSDQAPSEVDHRWTTSMAQLNFGFLMLMRNGLNEQPGRVSRTLGLNNARFMRRISGMDVGTLMRISCAMPFSFLRCSETLALEVLVDRIANNGSEEELRMSLMAHAASMGVAAPDTRETA